VDQGKTVGWVCAGDVGIYSPFAYFERYLRAAGVSYEIVPAVSFLNGLAMAADNCLVEESGRLLMARIEDPQELPPLLAVASTVVLYSVGLSLAAGLRDYARREALEAAWLLKVGADRAGPHARRRAARGCRAGAAHHLPAYERDRGLSAASASACRQPARAPSRRQACRPSPAPPPYSHSGSVGKRATAGSPSSRGMQGPVPAGLALLAQAGYAPALSRSQAL